MNNKKLTGSFYTPQVVSDFVVKHIFKESREGGDIKVLEPSAGDGVFVRSFFSHSEWPLRIKKVVAVERNYDELTKIKISNSGRPLEFIHADFLEFQRSTKRKFDIVVGNPPYIKKTRLSKRQIELCKEVHQSEFLSRSEPKNIWTAFLVRSIGFLNETGIMAFILPAEILQVKFASELRELVYKNFKRIEYFTFRELIFDAQGQDTVLLIAYKESANPGIYFSTINSLSDLSGGKFKLQNNDFIRQISTKEAHHDILSDDLQYLHNLQKRLLKISDFTQSKPGIVTAANNYFIVNREKRREFGLARFTKPIIQKGAFVNGKVEFNEDDWQSLSINEFPCYLVDFNNVNVSKQSKKVAKYIRLGKKLDIDNRYKCKVRDRWYCIPNISPPADGFFFKRSHHYPKLLKNVAGAYATDSAYIVNVKDGFFIESVIFSFYNSLTLLFAELEGRYYGGGVLELTPSEFKNLPLPYIQISDNVYRDFANHFADKNDISDILNVVDASVLTEALGLTQEDIDRLGVLRNRLVRRRLKL